MEMTLLLLSIILVGKWRKKRITNTYEPFTKPASQTIPNEILNLVTLNTVSTYIFSKWFWGPYSCGLILPLSTYVWPVNDSMYNLDLQNYYNVDWHLVCWQSRQFSKKYNLQISKSEYAMIKKLLRFRFVL